MKIITITPDTNNENIDLITNLLALKEINDVLFDNFNFKIHIVASESEIVDMMNRLMYRNLWEDVYLKSSTRSKYNGDKTFVLEATLSEVITFIKTATPPNEKLQKLIPDALSSIKSIVSSLEQFLTCDNYGQEITYYGILFKITRFMMFETNFNFTEKTMLSFDTICKQYDKLCIMGIPLITTSNISLHQLLYDNSISKSIINFKIRNPRELFAFVNALRDAISDLGILKYSYNNKGIYITDVYHYFDTSNTQLWVTLYIDNIKLSNSLLNPIKKIYDNFI